MSLSVAGVWQVGVWDQTVWADGVWREGAVTNIHRAEQIMQAFTTLINTLSPATVDKVVRGRSTPYATGVNKAISLIMGPDELVDDTGWPDVYSKLTINVDIHARSNSVQVTQLINDIAKVITTTLWADYTLGLSFVADMNEGDTDEPELDGDSSMSTGKVRTSWDFIYRRNRLDPST